MALKRRCCCLRREERGQEATGCKVRPEYIINKSFSLSEEKKKQDTKKQYKNSKNEEEGEEKDRSKW